MELHLNTLVYLSFAALAAYFTKRLTNKLGMPIVTGYVLIGVLLGISILKLFTVQALDHLTIVNDLALGLIGFTIGSELRKDVFKKLGKSIILIAFFESFITFILVTFAVYLIEPSKFYQAIILGAVASATAPAATVYVIQQYKAKGPLSSSILAVVGIDDAFALILFSFASILAKGSLIAQKISIVQLISKPVIEISSSIILGIVLGFIFVFIFRKVRFPDDLLLGTASFILMLLGLCHMFHLSGLLSVMAFGTTVSNFNPMLTNRTRKILENISPLLFAYFFIFAGAHLNITLLPQIGLLGSVYLVVRIIGKVSGASLGAILGGASKTIRKYIGLSLIPQVGVAIALAIMVDKEFNLPEFGEAGIKLSVIVINILLFTTIITEILGPILTKWALKKSGEIEK